LSGKKRKESKVTIYTIASFELVWVFLVMEGIDELSEAPANV
jgi:hypothetical protein